MAGRPGMQPRPRMELLADAEHPGGFMLLMDDVRQSYVDITDPTYLDFEYIQFFASVLEAVFGTPPARPLAVTHIGGGALTMPRYLHVSHPGSSQIVLEPDTELTALIRRRLPLPRGHRIRIRPMPGREGVAELGDGSADLLILDAYADGQVPASLATVEFFAEVARVLRPDGLLLANLVDDPGFGYLRRVLAGLVKHLPELALVSSSDVLKGRRFGNVVVAASRVPLPVTELRRRIARQPFPAGVRAGEALAAVYGSAQPWTDLASSPSPEPVRGWRVI